MHTCQHWHDCMAAHPKNYWGVFGVLAGLAKALAEVRDTATARAAELDSLRKQLLASKPAGAAPGKMDVETVETVQVWVLTITRGRSSAPLVPATRMPQSNRRRPLPRATAAAGEHKQLFGAQLRHS